MPKKFQGENSKASEARARKAAAKEAEDSKKKQELEDEYWRDDDKHVMKKQQRKEDKEKKKTEQLERKKELQKLHDEELESIKAATKPSQPSSSQVKVTRLQAEAHRATIAAADTAAANKKEGEKEVPVTELPLEQNVNRIVVDGEEARTVDEALSLLSTKDTEIDMHPEKRMKAAYLAYEEKNLPLIKEENPGLRLSQLKQIIRKNWNKAPENPLNQQQMAAAALSEMN